MIAGLERRFLTALTVAGSIVGASATPVMAQSCPSPPVIDGVVTGAAGAVRFPGEIVVQGRVVDGSDGVPVAGARVDSRWADEGGEAIEAESWTDPDGRFWLCGVPEGTVVRLSPEVGGGPGQEVTDRAGSGRDLTLVVPLPSPDERSGLLGRVREADSERAIGGAEVRLPELELSAQTDPRGNFYFQEVEPGSYRLEVTHLSYGTAVDTVHLVAGRPLQMRFALSPTPIRVEGVEATARSRRWFRERTDLQRRMQRGFGDVITREDILLRDEPPLHLLLNSIPGVRAEAVAQPWGYEYYPVIRSCGVPQMFVDGARIRVEPGSGFGIDTFLSSDIELIEVYKGAAGAPIRYSDLNAGCGVILIWTRTGW